MPEPIDSASDTGSGTTIRSLGLRIPQRMPPPEQSLFLSPNETSKWIASLPLVNIGETSRQVYTQLGKLNQYVIPTTTRVKETEAFRTIVAYISENLRRHYMDASFPLSPKAWNTLILSRELNNELAISYKILIEELLGNPEGGLDKKLLIIALHRALHFLSQVYLQVCLSYTTPPVGLWKEINTLFAFARQNQLHRVPVKMKHGDHDESSTIEQRYKALMLFATCSPARLAQSHLELTFHRARDWASLTSFLNPNEVGSEIDTLNVALRLDELPVHNALRKPVNLGQIALLDLSKLVSKLKEDLQKTPVDGAQQIKPEPDKMPRALIRQLIRNWHSPSERRFQRTQLNFSLKVLCGLRSIIGGLVAQYEQANSAQAAPEINPYSTIGLGSNDFSSSQGLETGSLSLMDNNGHEASLGPAFNASHHLDATQDYDASGAFDISGGSANSPVDLDFAEGVSDDHIVTTVNESANGYCIRWAAGEQLPKTRVGDLIGIGANDNTSGFSLGVVRWLRSLDQSDLEIGLEIISNQVKAAKVYTAIAEGKVPLRNRRDPTPGLLIGSLQKTGRKEKPSLILASASYDLGAHFWLEEPGTAKPSLIRLSRLIDFSGAFAQFAFDYVKKADSDTPAENSERSEFETLWKSL